MERLLQVDTHGLARGTLPFGFIRMRLRMPEALSILAYTG